MARRSAGQLAVYLGDELMGTLSDPGPGRFRFEYASQQVDQAAGAIRLSASLPVRARSYPNAAARPFFEGLLPEGAVRQAVARSLGVSPDNGFALLGRIGWECAGAVRVVPEGTPRPVGGDEVEWLTERELAERIAQLASHPFGLSAANLRLSLGGVQEKLIVVRRGDGTIGIPLAGTPSSHLLKPGPVRFESIVANELFCSRVLSSIGLAAARTAALDVGGTPCLLVERFDRVVGEDGQIMRLHQEDVCQALGILPAAKYEAEGGPSIAATVGLIRAVSVRPAADVTAFLRAVIANFVLGNSDAHGKNFAVLYRELGRAALAPLYDVVSTAVYDVEPAMAMSIGGVFDPGAVDEHAWRALAEQAGVGAALLVREVRSLAARIAASAQAVRASAAEEGWHAPVLDRIVDVAGLSAAQLQRAR